MLLFEFIVLLLIGLIFMVLVALGLIIVMMIADDNK